MAFLVGNFSYSHNLQKGLTEKGNLAREKLVQPSNNPSNQFNLMKVNTAHKNLNGREYCAASSPCDEYISNVTIGTINNTTDCSAGGYADYSSMSTVVAVGTPTALTVENGNGYTLDACGVWVDWNNNTDFTDDPAVVVSGNPGGGPYTASIEVPAGTPDGSYRMRVRIVYNVTPVPCGDLLYGEAEDYTLVVAGGAGTTIYATNFESFTAGTQVACQSTDWTTWSNAPCGPEDAMVSTDFAFSAPNAVKDDGVNDLVHLMGNKTAGKYEFTFQMYIPAGHGGYYNLLHNFAGASSEWGMEFYFEDAGTAQLHAGGMIIPYPYNHDQWFQVKNVIDIDNDWAEIFIDGTSVYAWQWSLDPSTGNPGLNQLSAVDFYSGSGATGIVNPLYYFDDLSYTDVSGPVTLAPPTNLAGTLTGSTVHLTWDAPARGFLGYNVYCNGTMLNTGVVTDLFYDHVLTAPGTYSYTVKAVYDEGESAAAGPVVINYGDIILMQNGTISTCAGMFYDTGGPSGTYQNSEDLTLTIAPGTAGAKMKFNFTSFECENTYDYLKVYDGADVSAPMVGDFTGLTVPAELVELVASASNTSGAITFHFTSDGSVVKNGWVAAVSCVGGGGNILYATDFEAFTTGQQVACQDPVNWTTWNESPCDATTDAYISEDYAHSPVKSMIDVANNDEVLRLGNKTTGKYEFNFNMYVPTDFCGYYNVLQNFDNAVYNWGVEVYFHTDGTGMVNAGVTGATTFNYAKDTWIPIKNIIDLDNDQAELIIDGVSIYTWQWTLGASGTTGPLQLAASDFYGGADANYPSDIPKYYLDDVEYKSVGVAGAPHIVVTPAALTQQLEPNATGTQTLNIANTGGAPLNFDIAVNYTKVKSIKVVNHTNAQYERVTSQIPVKCGKYTIEKQGSKLISSGNPSDITRGTTNVNKYVPHHSRATVYVNQTGNPSAEGGYASQTFTDYPTYSCAGADDFIVPSGATWSVNHVYVNGTVSVAGTVVPAVDVVFYSDASGYPGTAVATYTGISCVADPSGFINVFLPTTATLTEGHYWVSVAASMDFATYGQWYWTKEAAPTILNELVWQNPGGGFGGCTSWCYGSVQWPANVDFNFGFALSDSTQAPPPTGWLAATPLTGTVPAGGNTDITVTFDATGLAVGTYGGNLAITSNDPAHPVKNVPATLEVKLPAGMPFFEDWSSGGFSQNEWTFDPGQSNWMISTTWGYPAPSAEFNWSPSITNYSFALVTPMLDATTISDNVTLKFDIELNNFSTSTLEGMAVEVFDGSAWQMVHDYTNVSGSFVSLGESYNLTGLVAGHNFSVRFRAYGANSFNINYWYLDNVKIYQQVVGNLTGTVTQLSDGAPVPGALVTMSNSMSGVYTATTGADGVYNITGAEAGNYALKLEKVGYNVINDNVTILGNQTVTANYALTAPIIGVDPTSISVTVPVGTTTTRTVTVSNTGNGPMAWAGSIQSNKKVSIPKFTGTIQPSDVPVSFGRAPYANKPTGTSSLGDMLRATTGYAFDIYPGYNFFSFSTDAPGNPTIIAAEDPSVQVFGGTFDASHTDFMWVIDYTDGYVKKVDVATGAVTSVGYAGLISGQTPTGLTCDKTSGTLYAAGTDGSTSTIYTVDPVTGAATIVGNTNDPLLIDICVDGTGQMYGFDIGDDNAYLIDKATGASTIIGSIGFNANYAQGMGWDPTEDAIYLAAYSLDSGGGELRVMDKTTGNTTLIGAFAGEVDGLGFPGGGSNWASIDPASGTINAGGTQNVTVTFDGSYVPPQKDLTVTGNLNFTTVPNVGSPQVALSMTITGSFFGVLAGAVTHGGAPVAGVTVTATRQETPVYVYTMVTGADGLYNFPTTLYGTYDFTATKDGFNPYISAEPAHVVGDQTTVFNIAMVAPIMGIDPLSISVTTPFGNVLTREITVSNTGDGTLEWTAAVGTSKSVSIPKFTGTIKPSDVPVSFGRAPVVNKPTTTNTIGDMLRATTGYAFDIYPGYNFFSFSTDDPTNPTIISSITEQPFGGTFDNVHTDFMWIIDYTDGNVKTVDIATGAFTTIGYAGLISGQTPTGLTCDKTTGILYASGTDGSTSTIYTVDPTTGAATVVGNTNDPLLIEITVDGAGQMYGFDIGDDNAYLIDKATGASTLLGSIGFNANYAQGMGWDPVDDIIYLAAYSLDSGGGELRIMDKTTGNTTLVGPFAGEVDGLGFPGGGTPPWLTIDKKTGILPAGASEVVTVTLDATIPPESKDFTRNGTITFGSDPNVGTTVVPVSLTVTGDFYGQCEGIISHGGAGVPNAIVTATKSGHAPYTATTDGSGHFLMTQVLGGTYDVTVTAAGYNDYSTTGVIVVPAQTTTLNVSLLAPTMIVSPTGLDVVIQSGQTTDRTLNINNTGDGILAWAANLHMNSKRGIHIPRFTGTIQASDVPVSFGKAPVANRPAGGNSLGDLLRATTGYAFDIYPGYNFFSISTDDPGNPTIIAAEDPSLQVFGGTFDATNTDFMWVLDYTDGYVKKVDVATGAVTSVGYAGLNSGQTPTGLTCDKTTGILYAAGTDGSTSTIYTVDPATGAATVVGNTNNPLLIDICVDGTGQMYGFDIGDDNAYLIDKATGASTVIGSIGFNANYAQGMGWDPVDDVVYLAAYSLDSGGGELRVMDRTTGATTLIGALNGETDGLGFPGGGSAWMSMDPKFGILPAGNSQNANVHFDATDLADGIYTGTITFVSAPNVGSVVVPVTMTVGAIGGPTLTIDQVTNAPAGPVALEVHASEIANMGSFQFTMEYDATHLTYTGTSNWYTGITDVLVGTPSAGKLTFVWAASSAGVTIADGKFFDVDFTFDGSLLFANVAWSDNPTPREFADWDGNIFTPVYHNGFVTGSTNGVPENGAQAIKVFPNPTSDLVNIKSDYTIKNIELLSFIGQSVYTRSNLNSKLVQIDVSSLGSGVYFVKMDTDQGIKTTKITVKR